MYYLFLHLRKPDFEFAGSLFLIFVACTLILRGLQSFQKLASSSKTGSNEKAVTNSVLYDVGMVILGVVVLAERSNYLLSFIQGQG